MDTLTPAGRQIILDLLAKSVEKVQKNEKGEKETKTQKKRKGSDADKMLKKKKVRKTQIKEEYKEIETAEIKLKNEPSDLETVPINIKTEFTKVETDILEKKDENTPPKQSSNEGFIVKVLREKIAKYSFDNNNTLSSIKREFKDATIVDNQDNFKKEDKLSIETSNYKSEKIKKNTRKTVLNKIKTEPADTETEIKSMKTEYKEVKMDRFDVKIEKNEQIFKVQSSSYCHMGEHKQSTNTRMTVSECGKAAIKLKEVTQSLKETTPKTKSKNKVKVIVKKFEDGKSSNQKRKFGTVRKKFTPEEDAILLNAMGRYGDKIIFAKLGREIGRNHKSIINRIDKLKKKNGPKKRRDYTLVDDMGILDAVLKHVEENQSIEIERLNLPNMRWKIIAALNGRTEVSLRLRWGNFLQPWILQHYSGTLNLEIRRMLANYLADNFKNIDSIDWQSVSTKTEFAGHTQASLRTVFFNNLYKETKRNLNDNSEDITLEMVAEYANKAFAQGGRKVLDKILTRQKEVIDYFECYVKKKSIQIL